MNKRILCLAIVVLITPSLALNYTVVDNKLVFTRPVYNVNVIYEDTDGNLVTKHSFVIKKEFFLFKFKRLISVSWDNETWLQIDKLDNSTKGWLLAEGKTENAMLCLQARKEDVENKEFWDEPEHCYTKVLAYVNGRLVSETFADELGNWKLEIRLAPGKNDIRIVARDPGGNEAEERLNMTWNASLLDKLVYYLSLKESQMFLTGLAIIAIAVLALVKFEERRKVAREEAIKRNLSQLIEDEALLIRKYGDNIEALISSPEFRTIARKMLLSEPFYTLIDRSTKKYKTLKGNPEALKSWLEKDFRDSLKALLKRFDPNLHRMGHNARFLAEAYFTIAKGIMKERSEGSK